MVRAQLGVNSHMRVTRHPDAIFSNVGRHKMLEGGAVDLGHMDCPVFLTVKSQFAPKADEPP